MWQTPKTDWVATDPINVSAYNRWKYNLMHIQKQCKVLYELIITDLGSAKTVSDYPYADMLNNLETALENVNEASYNFAIGATKTFNQNQPYIEYNEINRIESATLKLYETLKSQYELKRHLAFTLGGTRVFDVPRKTYRPFNRVMAWRLGNDKTFCVPRV